MWNGSSTYTHIVHYLNNRRMGCYHTHDKLELKPQVSGLFFFYLFFSFNGTAYMERSQNSLESPIKQILLLDCIRNVPDDENKKGQIGSILSNEQNACSKTNWRASYMQFEQTFFKKKQNKKKQTR